MRPRLSIFVLSTLPGHITTEFSPPPEIPRQALCDLITANHILHHNSIIDSFGHVSIRHPNDSSVYIMAADPGNTVHRADDLFYYRVNDSAPLPFPNGTSPGTVSSRSERFIHGEIMDRFSNINSVVHSHALPVLAYATSLEPLVPVYHMARSIGLTIPLWDITTIYNATDEQNMLVNNERFGSALASAFAASNGSEASSTPDYTVVLQRYHGFTTVATTLQDAVFQAIYTTNNAIVQTEQLALRRAVQGAANGSIVPFNLNAMQVGPNDYAFRGWSGWAWEVEHLPQYANELK